MRYSGVGGQAVMEGVMMKNKDKYAVAVRKPNHEIEVKVSDCKSVIKNEKLRNLPIVRGVVNFIESLSFCVASILCASLFSVRTFSQGDCFGDFDCFDRGIDTSGYFCWLHSIDFPDTGY